MRKLITGLVLLVLVVGCASSALADNLIPPPWERGSRGTTFQEWLFDSDPGIPVPGTQNTYSIAPDVVDNDYGDVVADVCGIWQSNEGAFHLSGNIKAKIPNTLDPIPPKSLWVQLTWRPWENGSGEEPLVRAYDGYDPLGTEYVVAATTTDLGTGWYYSTYAFEFSWNPPKELIYVTGNIVASQLVVDTQCIPEPGTIVAALAVLSPVCLVFRRKRS